MSLDGSHVVGGVVDGAPEWNVMMRTCPSRTSLARIANKWTAMVVIALGDGPQRFGEIRSMLDGISAKVLTETLRTLEEDGIVTRHAFAEMPPRVEYELTALGQTLHAPLDALRVWAEVHIPEVLAARATYSAVSGRAPE